MQPSTIWSSHNSERFSTCINEGTLRFIYLQNALFLEYMHKNFAFMSSGNSEAVGEKKGCRKKPLKNPNSSHVWKTCHFFLTELLWTSLVTGPNWVQPDMFWIPVVQKSVDSCVYMWTILLVNKSRSNFSM